MLELSQVSLIIPANLCAFLFPCKPVAAHETPFITEHHQNTPGMSPIFSLIKLTIMKILYALQYLPEYLLCKAKAAVSSCSADIKIAIVYNKKKSRNGEYSYSYSFRICWLLVGEISLTEGAAPKIF